MTLPNFILCGIQKGGTTALYEYLRSHPDVYCPERKELCFFDQNWANGLPWYESFFQDSGSALAVGEASPHYMRSAKAAARIRETLDGPKLIFILRDPIQRAFSNYNYNLGRGQQDPSQSFEEAIQTPDGVERYLDKGLYQRDLACFETIFGRKSMLVVFAEDLRIDPKATLDPVFQFIGVNPNRWRPTELSSNTTRVPRPGFTQATLYRWGCVRRHLVPFVPTPLARVTRGLRRRVHAHLPQRQSRPKLQTTTQELLTAYYHDANLKLAEWLGPETDQPDWLHLSETSSA